MDLILNLVQNRYMKNSNNKEITKIYNKNKKIDKIHWNKYTKHGNNPGVLISTVCQKPDFFFNGIT